MNTQRDVIYKERRKILEGADLKANILDDVRTELTTIVDMNTPGDDSAEWDLEALIAEANAIVKLPEEFTPSALAAMTPDGILDAIMQFAADAYEDKEEALGADVMRALERLVMLRAIDSLWVEHLTAMDEMRQGIGLQAYGQSDPLVAYKREAHDMWGQLLSNIRNRITRSIYHVEIAAPQQAAQRPVVTVASQPAVAAAGAGGAPLPATNGAPAQLAGDQRAKRAVASSLGVNAAPQNLRTNQPVDGGGTTVVAAQKVGRNDPCHCGSGKKFKKCHGA
jgi:preprotein translocase subunit SecA